MKHSIASLVPPASPAVARAPDESGLYQEVHRADLQARLVNPEASYALAQWTIRAAAGGVPDEHEFARPHLDWLKQDMMLLRREPDGDFTYRHYGARIIAGAGFDMTGRRVSEFQGVLGQFFRAIYAEAVADARPIATVHRLGNFRERPLWERVILPLSSDGQVEALYVINRVRDLGREFNASSARSRGNGVIALQFVRAPSGRITDAIIVGANLPAREMTGRRLDELLHRPMIDCFPGVIASGLWDRYLAVSEMREPQRFALTYDRDGVDGTFDVEIAPFLDGVSIDFAWRAGA